MIRNRYLVQINLAKFHQVMKITQPKVEEVLRLLAHTPLHISSLTRDIPNDKMISKPDPESWSANEVLAHLRAINTASDGFHDTLTLTISFRLPLTLTPADTEAALAAFAEPDGELRAYSTAQAYLGDKNNALVRGLLAAIRAQGERPGFVLKGGTSDMNVVGVTWACPIVAYGPGDSSLDHTPEERQNLAEYAQAVATLTHLIEHLD